MWTFISTSLTKNRFTWYKKQTKGGRRWRLSFCFAYFSIMSDFPEDRGASSPCRSFFLMRVTRLLFFLAIPMLSPWFEVSGSGLARASEGNMGSFRQDPYKFQMELSRQDGMPTTALCDGSRVDSRGKTDLAPDEIPDRFKENMEEMLRETPMYPMMNSISRFDRETASFLIAIAKKESSWGEHAPQKDGEDCFNYWGYKGRGGRGESMGYACFSDREQAVGIVGGRISTLVHKNQLNSPERLIVWKCGSSCAGHDARSVAKWISDVRFVYEKVTSADNRRAAF